MQSETSLLPCRKCGSTDIEMWDGRGTQAGICCNECGQTEDLQVSDILEYDVRFAPENNFNMQTLSYPQTIVGMAKERLIKEWNTRAPSVDMEAVIAEIEALGEHIGAPHTYKIVHLDKVLAILTRHLSLTEVEDEE